MHITTAWQHISPQVIVKGFKQCYTSNAVDGIDDDMLWNGSEEHGNVRSECEEDEGTDCKGAQNVTCFVYWVCEIKSKIFLLGDVYFWGVIFD